MTSRTRRRTAVALGAGVAAIAAAEVVHHRWTGAHDPTDGEPLCLPAGDEVCVEAPDGAQLATLVAGDDRGHHFVLSHCWTGDRRVWGPVARRLVDAGHRVVLYDQRGHGASTIGGDGCTVPALAGDLAAVLEHVDARGAVVGGHSMGGMAVQALAGTRPEQFADRAKAMVLVATACDRISRGRLFEAAAARLVGSTRIEWGLTVPRLAPWLVRGAVGRAAALPHLHAIRETFMATPAETRAELLASMCAMDLAEDLRRVRVPAVVVAGSRDLLTPPSRSRRVAELLPAARLELVPGAGHMLPAERPDHLTGLLVHTADTAPPTVA